MGTCTELEQAFMHLDRTDGFISLIQVPFPSQMGALSVRNPPYIHTRMVLEAEVSRWGHTLGVCDTLEM